MYAVTIIAILLFAAGVRADAGEGVMPAEKPVSLAEAEKPIDYRHSIALCAAIEDTVRRGECYDRLAETLGVAKLARSQASVGEWIVQEDVSPIDDSRSVILTLRADEEVQISRYDRVQPWLVLRCFENTTSMYIDYDHFLGSGHILVTHRIDDRDAENETWWISTDHNAIGLWDYKHAYPLIKQMLDARHLLIRLTPYSESAVTAAFQIQGLRTAIVPLAKACGWTVS